MTHITPRGRYTCSAMSFVVQSVISVCLLPPHPPREMPGNEPLARWQMGIGTNGLEACLFRQVVLTEIGLYTRSGVAADSEKLNTLWKAKTRQTWRRVTPHNKVSV